MRSRHGCDSCRARKVKCDEERPICSQCKKAHRKCAFSHSTLFRNHDPRRSRHDEGAASPLQSPTMNHQRWSYSASDVWVEVPKTLTFIQVDGDGEDIDHAGNSGTDHNSSPKTHLSNPSLATDRGLMTASNEHGTGFRSIGPGSEANNAQSPHPYAYNELLGLSTSRSPWAVEYSSAAHSAVLTSHEHQPEPSHSADTGFLESQLLRYFQEGPGQWMDIFDTSSYFSRQIPLKASQDQLLKYAVCALSAKHLHRIPKRSRFSRSLESAASGGNSRMSWDYLSAIYYDKATTSLKSAVASLNSEEDSASSLEPSEEILAAITILCQYELMDVPGHSWAVHLSAAPLFIADSTPGDLEVSYRTVPRSAIPGPIFWSLARQDLLCASIGETQTRLQVQDLRLWHHAGLNSMETRLQLPISPGMLRKTSNADVEEDMKARELICILSKLTNFVTAGDALDPPDYARPEGQRMTVAVAQEILLERWKVILSEMTNWRASLPPSFTPRRQSEDDNGHLNSNTSDETRSHRPPSVFPKIWYETPMCAAAMLLYHMGCVLLHANRPQESTAIRSTVFARLISYQRDVQHALEHAREICGIVSIERSEAVLFHAVQPVFVAGQVFSLPEEQEAITNMLVGIERDIGCSTSFFVKKLQENWSVAQSFG